MATYQGLGIAGPMYGGGGPCRSNTESGVLVVMCKATGAGFVAAGGTARSIITVCSGNLATAAAAAALLAALFACLRLTTSPAVDVKKAKLMSQNALWFSRVFS